MKIIFLEKYKKIRYVRIMNKQAKRCNHETYLPEDNKTTKKTKKNLQMKTISFALTKLDYAAE